MFETDNNTFYPSLHGCNAIPIILFYGCSTLDMTVNVDAFTPTNIKENFALGKALLVSDVYPDINSMYDDAEIVISRRFKTPLENLLGLHVQFCPWYSVGIKIFYVRYRCLRLKTYYDKIGNLFLNDFTMEDVQEGVTLPMEFNEFYRNEIGKEYVLFLTKYSSELYADKKVKLID